MATVEELREVLSRFPPHATLRTYVDDFYNAFLIITDGEHEQNLMMYDADTDDEEVQDIYPNSGITIVMVSDSKEVDLNETA